MAILITGAGGYIGARLTIKALESGHQVVAASRRKPPGSTPWVRFDLADAGTVQLPDGIDAIIHLAANTSASCGVTEADELHAADVLIEAARASGARLVFVSSQAASEDAPTAYGRIKWQIERKVVSAGGLVVRLGLVYGGLEEGLFGVMVRLVRRLPILPAFLPVATVQPIHVDDCASGLLALMKRKSGSGVLALGADESLSFTVFLSAIARHRLRQVRFFVPMPIFLMRVLINTLSRVSPNAFGLARLRSLFSLPPLQPAGDTLSLGLNSRPLEAGMHPSGDTRRRLLATEGMGLLIYVLRDKPGIGLVKRYVRMIESLRAGEPIHLPAWLYHWPFLLACLDGRAAEASPAVGELRWRIIAATHMGEASLQGFERFLVGGRSTCWLLAYAAVGRALIAEASVRLARLCVLPSLRLIIGGHRE